MEISEDGKRALTAANQALKADKETLLAESRVRAIIHEELAAWEKRQLHKARFGLPLRAETK